LELWGCLGLVSPRQLLLEEPLGLSRRSLDRCARFSRLEDGIQKGSTGTAEFTDPGTAVDARLAQVSIGKESGSQGSLAIRNLARLAVDQDFYVGDGGTGDLSLFSGTVSVQNGAALRVGRNCYISRTGLVKLDRSARVAVGSGDFGPPGSLRICQGGKLWGKGATNVQGQIIVGLGGAFRPGGSPGIFSIDGDYLQESGGELDIEIDGTDPDTSYSQVKISGAATLGGTLNIILGNGFKPQPSQTSQILSAATVNGTFAQVHGASVNYGQNGVILSTVTGIQETAPPALSVETAAGQVWISWPDTTADFTLQGSTNLTLGNWTPLPSSANSALLSATNALGFFRLAR
jgi:hypothetical protein